MGLSSSKSKTKSTNAPPKWAKPYILKGLQQSSRVFDMQQPELENYAKMQRDSYGRVAPGAEEGILGAQVVVNDNLSGSRLNGNPHLDAILAATRANTTNAVDGRFSAAGRYGSGSHAGILAKAIAEAETQARFNNYAMERGYQNSAVDQAQSLMGGAQGMLNNAAELPWLGVGALNGNVRQASNGYGTQKGTQTQSQPWGPMLASAAGSFASAFSDRRLKTKIEQIGPWDDRGDGLMKYRFAYKSDPSTILEGVMADEVKATRPSAYIPNYRGTDFAGVNYAELGA